jgi:hypothetical protein
MTLFRFFDVLRGSGGFENASNDGRGHDFDFRKAPDMLGELHRWAHQVFQTVIQQSLKSLRVSVL